MRTHTETDTSVQQDQPSAKIRVRAGRKPKKPTNGVAEWDDSPLTRADLRMFNRILVEEATLTARRVRRVTHDQALAMGFSQTTPDKQPRQLQGIVFYYQDRDGHFANIRLRRDVSDVDPRTGKESGKYLLLYGDGASRVPYLFPEDYAKLEDKKTVALIVESEKSKLALDYVFRKLKINIVPMATGGCWGISVKAEEGAASAPLTIYEELLSDRKAIVEPDANLRTNADVYASVMFLARWAERWNSTLLVAETPLEAGVNGPDDYVGRHSKRLEDYKERVLDCTVPPYMLAFVTAEQIKNAREPVFLFDKFIQTDGASLLTGLSGHGKTWILLAIAKAALTGEKLFGHFKTVNTINRVVLLTPEVTLSALKKRIVAMKLMPYVEVGRLLIQPISDNQLGLTSPELLMAVRGGALLLLDPAIRFMEGDEKSNMDIHRSLSTGIFKLLAAGAVAIIVTHHAPKAFVDARSMSLENASRGGGDIGAIMSAAYGVRDVTRDVGVDRAQVVLYIENLKHRDFEAPPQFQLIGTPWSGKDLEMRLKPGESESLDTILPRKAGAPKSEEKESRLVLMRRLLFEEKKSDKEAVDILSEEYPKLKRSTIERDVRRQRKVRY